MDCQKVRERTRELQREISAIDGARRAMVEHCQMLFAELDTIPESVEDLQALKRKRDRLKREIADLDRTLHEHRAAIADVVRELLHDTAELPLMRRRLRNLVDVLESSNGHFNPDTLRPKVML